MGHQVGKAFAFGLGVKGDVGFSASVNICLRFATHAVQVKDGHEVVASGFCVLRGGDTGPGAVFFVTEEEADGALWFVGCQDTGDFEKGRGSGGIVVGTGGVHPAL